MTNVLITHADEPVGRRIVKTLYHDPDVETIFAIGDGPAPRAFDRFLASSDPHVSYARVDLAKHRPVSDLFHSSRFREAEVDTVVHVPRHGAPAAQAAPISFKKSMVAGSKRGVRKRSRPVINGTSSSTFIPMAAPSS